MPETVASAKPPVVLTIAGFDPSSGAGVTADLQVFSSMGLFGTACPTAVTVQSTLGVARVETINAELLREMLQFLVRDMPPAGIKVGMLGNLKISAVVSEFLAEFNFVGSIPVVIDPVMRSSSGAVMLEEGAWDTFLGGVCRGATCLTPNQAELAMLTDHSLDSAADIEHAAHRLLRLSGAESVIVTGGDAASPDDLVLQRGQLPIWLKGNRVETNSTHGTGCAFSSAVLSRLVLGDEVLSSGKAAKLFVERSLKAAPGLGHGKGPMKLTWPPRQ